MNANGKQDYRRNADHARRMTEIALRGTALLWDLQADAARNLLETQARSATLLGAPDLTQMFHLGEGRTSGLFTTTIDQALSSLRQINETATEVQWQLARVAEQQTAGIAEHIQQGIEKLGRRSQQGLQEIRRIAQEEADEIEASAREARERAGAREGRRAEEPGGERTPQGPEAANQEGAEARQSGQRRESQRRAAD
jgi:phasin protein